MQTPIPNISATVNQSFQKHNITSLEQLTNIDEKSLLMLHGVGPKTINTLKASLKEANLSMLEEPFHPFTTDFLVFGDLKCDNAPKRRIIRDYLIMLWMKDESRLGEVVNENVMINSIKQDSMEGIENLIKVINEEDESIISLEIPQILSHGKEGSAHGVVTFASGAQKYFAEFYQFESTKKDARIKRITRYTIE